MFIKIYILLACTTLILAKLLPRENWVEAAEICAEENGGLPDETNAEEWESCVIACAMKRKGSLSEEGVYLPEKVIAGIPKEYNKYEETVAVLRMCSEKVGKSDCETASILRRCLLENLPCDDDWECGVLSYELLFDVPETRVRSSLLF